MMYYHIHNLWDYMGKCTDRWNLLGDIVKCFKNKRCQAFKDKYILCNRFNMPHWIRTVFLGIKIISNSRNLTCNINILLTKAWFLNATNILHNCKNNESCSPKHLKSGKHWLFTTQWFEMGIQFEKNKISNINKPWENMRVYILSILFSIISI